MSPKLTIDLTADGIPCIRVDGEELGPFSEILLEHTYGLSARIKIRLLSTRGLEGEELTRVARVNDRNRFHLQSIREVEVFEGNVIPGWPWSSAPEDRTRV